MQDFLSNIYMYCEELSSETDPLLIELERITHLKTLSPRMLSGTLQGKLISLLSQIKQPKNILEIGTFTGYATLCLAEGLTVDGNITTIELDPEVAQIASSFFKKSKHGDKITLIVDDAKKAIIRLNVNYDIVFIDADKMANAIYYDLIIEKCNPGALILVDNVLWNGKVADEKKDQKTQALHDFNVKISNDPRVENLVLPLRDGINMMRKL